MRTALHFLTVFFFASCCFLLMSAGVENDNSETSFTFFSNSCSGGTVTVTTSTTPADCDANNGTATAVASSSGSGSSGTYTYVWSNSTSGSTITGLAPGTYSVTATDTGSGCTDSAIATVGTNSGSDDDCDGVPNSCDICPGGDDSIDNNGNGVADCSELLSYNAYSSDWHCKNNKITICHKGKKTLCVNKNSLPAHFGHGDYVGPCTSCASAAIVFNTDVVTQEHFTPELEVFPNPTTDQVNIHVHDFESEGYLSIYDLNGRMIYSQEINEENWDLTINLNDYQVSTGIYLVKMQNKDISLIQRLVVQK